jgi:hypothetical protein
MISLVAEIKVVTDNSSPFVFGQSKLGDALFGETVNISKRIDKRSILSCNSEIKSTGDVEVPWFGMVSCGGNISFKDYDKQFLKYAENGILTSGNKINIFIENGKNAEQLVGTYFTTKWEYDMNSRSVSVSFSDGLDKLQEVELEEYNLIEEKKVAVRKIFEHIEEKIVENGFQTRNMLPEVPLGCIIQYPKVSSGNAWSQMTKVLEAVGGTGYIDKDGYLTFNTGF